MILDRKRIPHIVQTSEMDFVLPKINEQKLKNNLPFYFYKGGSQEVVNFELVFEAGSWYENQAGIAAAVATLIKNGTKNKTALKIDAAFEQWGAHLKTSATYEFATIGVSCLQRHFQKVLPLILEICCEASFPEKEIELYKKNSMQQLSINLTKTDFNANRWMDEYLYGKAHPYGRYMMPSDYEILSQEKLKAFYETNYHLGKMKLFLAGNFTDSDLKAVEEHFGEIKIENNSVVVVKEFEKISLVEKKHRVTINEKPVQGSVRVARHFLSKYEDDFLPCIFLNTLFGGYFGSRLMSNIREDKGYTYGIYSQIYNTQQPSSWTISTEAGADVCESTIEEIFKEMKILREQKVSDEEIQTVKNYLLGSLLGDLDGPFQIMQRWKNLILNNFTIERFDKSIDIYKNISPKQLQELANKYLIEEDFYHLVVV